MEFTKVISSYTAFPTFETQLATGGNVRIVATDANHVHFDANHHALNGRPGDRCFIVCRGIEYGASLHFNRVNGQWAAMDRPYVSRLSTSKDASGPAVQWITSKALEVLSAFVAQYPEVLAAAERKHVEDQMETVHSQLEDARARVAELETRLAELQAKL